MPASPGSRVPQPHPRLTCSRSTRLQNDDTSRGAEGAGRTEEARRPDRADLVLCHAAESIKGVDQALRLADLTLYRQRLAVGISPPAPRSPRARAAAPRLEEEAPSRNPGHPAPARPRAPPRTGRMRRASTSPRAPNQLAEVTLAAGSPQSVANPAVAPPRASVQRASARDGSLLSDEDDRPKLDQRVGGEPIIAVRRGETQSRATASHRQGRPGPG